jgi:hypothetical protein
VGCGGGVAWKTREVLERAFADGHGDEDFSALVEPLRNLVAKGRGACVLTPEGRAGLEGSARGDPASGATVPRAPGNNLLEKKFRADSHGSQGRESGETLFPGQVIG